MFIPKILLFKNLINKETFNNFSEEYKLLNSLNDIEWGEYCNKMLGNKKSVTYNAEEDNFVVKVLKEKQMKKYVKENLGFDDDLESLFDDQPETSNSNKTITLDDLRSVLAEFLPKQNQIESIDLLSETDDDIEETIIDDSNSILTSEFDEILGDTENYDTSGDYVEEISGYNKPTEEFDFFNDETDFTPDDDFEDELEYSFTPSYEETEPEYQDEDSEDLQLLLDDEEEVEIPVEEEIENCPPCEVETINKEVNLGGVPVQIILTGIMLSTKELGYLGENFKRENVTLRKISGNKNSLKMLAEYANKTYIINYKDTNKGNPFSIKNYSFSSLNEAIRKIKLPIENKNKQQNQLKEFKKFVGNDLANRSLNNFKGSDIFEDYEPSKLNYTSTWSVKNVGMLNLKNGINEVYSNVTQHTKEANTLVKNKEGQYFLIKGNHKNRTIIGEKRQIIDSAGKKDYGINVVIGLYENTQKGLGQIMFETKRTTIPLLIWK